MGTQPQLALLQSGRRRLCCPGAVTGTRPGLADTGQASAPLCLLPGLASVVVSFFLSMYYNIINAWAFWYLFHSFQVSQPRWEQEPPPGGSLRGWGRGQAEHPMPSGGLLPWCARARVWLHVPSER